MLYLIHFFENWSDFRLAEFRALLRLAGVDPSLVLSDASTVASFNEYNKDTFKSAEVEHFLIAEFPNEQIIHDVCHRSILIKAVYELWGSGSNSAECVKSVSSLSRNVLEPYLLRGKSWSIRPDAFCKSLSMTQKNHVRDMFKFLEFRGDVNIEAPDTDLWIVMDFSKHRELVIDTSNTIPVPTYFGRLVARGGMRDELKKYDLKKRLYLGPTSLDDSLAFILANLSGVRQNMFTLDPFVGLWLRTMYFCGSMQAE
jgi:tRNA (guanine10-N2)-methyltransferase